MRNLARTSAVALALFWGVTPAFSARPCNASASQSDSHASKKSAVKQEKQRANSSPAPAVSYPSKSSANGNATSEKSVSSLQTPSPGASASVGRTTNSRTSQPPPKVRVVWVNTASKVYHLPGSRWYGKTRHGRYMTEEDAIKAGYRPASKQ
jgi:hypothetical protein